MLSVIYAEVYKLALDAECHYAECRDCSVLMLSIIVVSVMALL